MSGPEKDDRSRPVNAVRDITLFCDGPSRPRPYPCVSQLRPIDSHWSFAGIARSPASLKLLPGIEFAAALICKTRRRNRTTSVVNIEPGSTILISTLLSRRMSWLKIPRVTDLSHTLRLAKCAIRTTAWEMRSSVNPGNLGTADFHPTAPATQRIDSGRASRVLSAI
jgi:hypothetical protein